jgi:dsRNA-specific ribonuclease
MKLVIKELTWGNYLKLEESREEELKIWLQKNKIQFDDLELFDLALTHASWPKEINNNNERLAFLGDAVLDLLIAELLYMQFLEEDKGSLTEMRTDIVKREYLANIGKLKKIEDIIQRRGLTDYKKSLERLLKQ